MHGSGSYWFSFTTVGFSNPVAAPSAVLSGIRKWGRMPEPMLQVAQLYINDCVASRVRPVQELKGFEKVCLKPGEAKKVSFKLRREDGGKGAGCCWQK